MQVMRSMNMPLPKALATPVEFIINHDLCEVINDENSNLERLQILVNEATTLSLQLDMPTIQYEVSRKINQLMKRLEQSPADIDLLQTIEQTLKIMLPIASQPNVQTAQNVLFAISKQTYPEMIKKAGDGNQTSQKWVEHFRNLAYYLGITVQ
jgi:hypothetical protein